MPLDLMLVLDESGSISSSQWHQIRLAAVDLLDQVVEAGTHLEGLGCGLEIRRVLYQGH